MEAGESMPKRLLVFLITAIFMGLSLSQNVLAADNEPPEVINTQISSNTIAYQGSSVPGYVTLIVETNEPTRGYLMAEGNGRQIKINLSTTEFKTKHIVYWVPWDDAKKEPVPAGTYRLKSYLTDQAYNSAQGYPVGQITVVQESSPKALVTLSSVSPTNISPKYATTVALTEVKYELSRPAEVQVSIQKNGTDIYQSTKVKLEPGYHSFSWNGRNQNGSIVADGEYDVVFKTIELGYNYPATQQTINKLGKITIQNGENSIPEWRMKEIISAASFDSAVISPNNDGFQDTVTGKITLNEATKLTVFIATATGSHMNHVIAYQDVQPGTHTFNWNGTDMMGGKALNGNYYIKVMVTESNGATGYLTFGNNGVTVKDSTVISPLSPVKEVRVITDKTSMTVYPMDQGYTATKGETFKLISDQIENGYYQVLVKEQVPGKVKASDVELVTTSQPAPAKNYTEHTVVSGDTLWKISQKYSVSVNDIVQFNNLNVNQPLFIGQVIKIPVTTVEQPKETIHTVQSGDTLWKIAQKYSITVDALVQANNLNSNQYLYIGQKLVISTTAVTAPIVTQPNVIHQVQSGDTLWKISQKYGVSVTDIMQANNLKETDYLYIGQKLTIPKPNTEVPQVLHVVASGDTLWKISVNYKTTVQKIVEVNNLDVNQPLMIGQQLKVQ